MVRQLIHLTYRLGRNFAASIWVLLCLLPLSAPSAQTVPGVTKDKIVLGGVFALSGPVRFVTEPYEAGIRAYLNTVNAAGGVNGRKLEWIVEDDSYQPAKALAAVKKLVERDKVMVVFGHMGTPTSLAIAPYLEHRQVPFFPVTTLPEDPARTETFGLQANYADIMYHVTRFVAEKAGAKRIGYFYQNDDLGEFVRVGIERALKDMGMTLAANVGYERGTTDFSTQVLRLRDAGADAVLSVSVAPATATAIKQGQAVGFKPIWATFGAGGSNAMPDLLGPALEGVVFGSEVDHERALSGQDGEFSAAMSRYYATMRPDWGSIIGYSHARFIVELLKAAGPEPTRERLLQILNSGTEFDVGLMAPLNFGPKKHVGTNAVRIFRWENGRPKAETDWLPVSRP